MKTLQDTPRHSKTLQDTPRHSKTLQDTPRRSFFKRVFVYSFLTVLPFPKKAFSQSSKIETFVFGSKDSICHKPSSYFDVELIKKWKTHLKILKNNEQFFTTNRNKCACFSVEFASILDKDIYSYLIYKNKSRVFKKDITSLKVITNCSPHLRHSEDRIISEIRKRNICAKKIQA